MMNASGRTLCVVLAGVACSAGVAQAQWLTQSFQLQPGWNSVFLEVDPSPALADELFAGLPIETVWTPVPGRVVDGPPSCPDPDDAACTPPDVSSWWVWVPATDPAAVVRTMRVIRGGRVHLVKAAEATMLTVTGRPSASVTSWRSGFNLAGFHVVDDVNDTPTFGAYLSGSPSHANAAVFAIQTNGALTGVANPATTSITPGVGYWVRSNSDTDYDGPFEVDRGSLRGVDYGENLVEHYLAIKNLTSSARQVTVAYASSAAVPTAPPGLPGLAGNVPISYLDYQAGQVESAFQWHELTSNTWSLSSAGQPAARTTIRLGVRRAGLLPATLENDGSGSLYQGLLRVTGSQGFERWLPTSAEVLPGVGGAVAGVGSPRPGLYFGHVTVDHVAWITAGAPLWTNSDPVDPTMEPNPDGDASTLRPAPAELSFPILIHVSENGDYRLLTEVALLWRPGDEGLGTSGEYVLATPACDPQVCGPLEAGSIQDGQPFARRISTAAFSFDGDLPLAGSFDTVLSGQTVLPADHRLNPFRHRYHPDHDCDSDGECYEITRDFMFAFASEPPAGLDSPGWGDREVGGTYTEALGGLHRNPIAVSGRFDLRRVSDVPVLNAN